MENHIQYVHDIGKHQCDYCSKNRNSKNKYICPKNGIESNICNDCYKKITGKHTKKETEWSNYLDKELGTEGLLSSDRSLKSQGGCQLYRPDKLYTDMNYIELGECDEHQHLYVNGNYNCDEKRISDIYEEQGICGKTMCVIRWNPDKYVQKEGYDKVYRKERLKIYVELSKKLRKKTDHENKIHIYYLFYSIDNPLISKNIPFTHIHSMNDLVNI